LSNYVVLTEMFIIEQQHRLMG